MVQREAKRKKSGRWLCPAVFAMLAMLLFPGQLTVKAAETSHRQDFWHSGAGVAALLDLWEEEETQSETAGAQDRQSEDISSAAGKKSVKADVAKDDETDSSEKASEEEAAQQLVMANVNNVLNVRREPDSEAELVGYLYADCGGIILERRDGWTKLESGELIGWASDEYLLFGEEAQKAAEDNGRVVATTITGALRIRKAPSMDAGVYDLLEEGAEYEVVNADQLTFSDGIEISDDWVAVDFEGKTGFVSADYVKVEHLIDYGETIEQVEARKEEERQLAEAAKAEEEKAAAEAKKKQQQQEIEKTKALATSDELLLAALIQCEAGSDVYEGQVAVGAVVMNRVNSAAYPNTIKDVIFASGQFTPAGSGKLGRLIAAGTINSSCIQAAQDAMAGVSPVGTATHFRRAGSREGIVVGAHVFW